MIFLGKAERKHSTALTRRLVLHWRHLRIHTYMVRPKEMRPRVMEEATFKGQDLFDVHGAVLVMV